MTEKDAPLWFELDQDVEVMRYINGGKKSSMEDINNVFLPRVNQFTNPKQGWGLWQVNVLETDQYIGWILVRPMGFFSEIPELHNLELGWRFKQNSWGKGYATEAALAIKQALNSNNYNGKFSAIADPNNTASINIMKKIGMHYLENKIISTPQGDTEIVYYQM